MAYDHPRTRANRESKARRWVSAFDAARAFGGAICSDAEFADRLSRFTREQWQALDKVYGLGVPNTSVGLIVQEYRDRALKPIPDEYSWVDSLPEEYTP